MTPTPLARAGGVTTTMFEQIKNPNDFAKFIKQLQDQQRKIKNVLVATKIGEEQINRDITKSSIPVVQAIKEASLTNAITYTVDHSIKDEPLSIEDTDEQSSSSSREA